MEIIKDKINQDKLKEIALGGYKEMVKVAVDTEKGILAAGGEFHADCLEKLVENGSEPNNIWGANIYLDKTKEDRVEFIALINIRPVLNNRSMEIQDEEIKEKIKNIIDKLVE